MNLQEITSTGIDPAMGMLPTRMDSLAARVMLLSIGLQESRFEHRYQIVQGRPGAKGPARGFWQFERGTAASRGGVWGVFLHKSTSAFLKDLCERRGCPPTPSNIWEAIETDDVLAAGLARLLLWTDPQQLPAVTEEGGAFDLYIRTWRPGAWDRGSFEQRAELRAKWGRNHRKAMEFAG